MRLRKLFTHLVACMALFCGAAAHAQILYGATGGSVASNLFSIDPATGAGTVIGPIGFAVTGLALHPSSGVMYGVTSNNSPVCAACLITVNLTTGTGTLIGPLGLIIAEVAFRADGTLFGWSESSDDLATINIATGAATTVSDSGLSTRGDGMVFVGGTLYVMPENDDGGLYSINTASGLPTLVATLTGSASGGGLPVSAATTHPTTGVVFAASQNFGGPPAFLFTVNVATGAITNIGNTVTGIDALEFGPAAGPSGGASVPTLSQWALVLLALLIGAAALRRMRRR
jgi:IPTL-CTERM motif